MREEDQPQRAARGGARLVPATSGVRANTTAVPPFIRVFAHWWRGEQTGQVGRLLIRSALSISFLAIPAALTMLLGTHASFGPVISLSYVIAVCAAAWWGGALLGILVSCSTVPVVTLVATRGKILLPPHIDPVGLLVMFFIAILVSRVAVSRKRVEEVLRTANEDLESNVRARTVDLSRVAASLEAEVQQHRKTEAQLRWSEERYRLLFEDSPLA